MQNITTTHKLNYTKTQPYLQVSKLLKTHVYTDTKVIKKYQAHQSLSSIKTVHSSGPNEITDVFQVSFL